MKMSFSALYSKFQAGRRLTHLGTEGSLLGDFLEESKDSGVAREARRGGGDIGGRSLGFDESLLEPGDKGPQSKRPDQGRRAISP